MLVLVVVGLLAIALAAIKSSLPYLVVIAAVAIIAVVSLLVLHRLDRAVPAKGLSDDDREAVRASLCNIRDAVAKAMNSDKAHCRANVIVENRLGRLQMVGDLRINMDSSAEWGVSMRPGQGCAGVAWKTREPHVAVYPFEGIDGLEPNQAQLVDPDLRWIVSVPICGDEGKPKWVVNVDGKDERSREELKEKAVPVMETGAAKLRPFALKT